MPVGQGNSIVKGSEKDSLYSVDEASDRDWWAQSEYSQPKGDLHFCMVNESSVQSQHCGTHRKKDHGEGRVQRRFKNAQSVNLDVRTMVSPTL